MAMEQSWRKVSLSLERPYKDDNGEPIPVLLDITPQGEHIYEPQGDPSKILGQNLRRVFLERGVDFFERKSKCMAGEGEHSDDEQHDPGTATEHHEPPDRGMTTEELTKMRAEIIPQLYIALGEMSHAKELLTLLLSSTAPAQPSSDVQPPVPPPMLTATVVTKPPPIASVQAFNAQLSIGGKDEALRKAADIFKSATKSMERGRIRGEKYWVDALKLRRANWGLIPAPLPFGAPTGKGADKTSKDFLISFGLEEAPAAFRRRAVSHMPTYETLSDALVFPLRQRTRLRVSLANVDVSGLRRCVHNTPRLADDGSREGSLKAAQQEVAEQEIFSLLVKEASNLPASARVSERLIVIDAAQGIELRFELVDGDLLESTPPQPTKDYPETWKCDFIYFVLHALLLRTHTHQKSHRLGSIGIVRIPGLPTPTPAPILAPVIDLLQYEVFCKRVKSEIDKMVSALSTAVISSNLRFDAVGEIGSELVKMFEDGFSKKLGGEATLRVDNRHTLRLTFLSPSSLIAHLPQATLTVSSIPQLGQLLSDEIEHCLLSRVCELGSQLCEHVGGTWFVDLVTSRSVGRWEGCVLNFRIYYGEEYSIHCSAFRLNRDDGRRGTFSETYSPEHRMPILLWVEQTIKRALSGA